MNRACVGLPIARTAILMDRPASIAIAAVGVSSCVIRQNAIVARSSAITAIVAGHVRNGTKIWSLIWSRCGNGSSTTALM